MIESYIFKTIISFISLNAVFYLTKENLYKLNPKRNGFIKAMFNRLCFCLVPIFRWVFVALVLIIGIALGDDEFLEKIKGSVKNEKRNSNK